MKNLEITVPEMKPSIGLVMLCRGALGAEAKQQIQQMSQVLQKKLGSADLNADASFLVKLAYIDRHGPSLVDALSACELCDRVLICPLLFPDEPALRRWLDKVVMRWRLSTSGRQQHVATMPPVAGLNDFPEWLAHQVLSESKTQLPDVGNEVDDWERDPAGWSSVPEHKRLVLWCTGPRCAAKGAFTLWPKLTNALFKNPETRKNTLVMQTTCQYPCNLAPVMCVQPNGIWYGEMDEKKIIEMIDGGFQSSDRIVPACKNY